MRKAVKREFVPHPNGKRILTQASRYVATPAGSQGFIPTVESPAKSNRGTKIDQWQQNLGYTPPVPWCACFANSMYREAGYNSEIESGSVATMWWNAYRKKLLLPYPVPGCFVLFVYKTGDGLIDGGQPYGGGAHVELFVRWAEWPRKMWTIGGNTPIDGPGTKAGGSYTNDGVVFHVIDAIRPRKGTKIVLDFAVPRCIR